MKILYEKPPIYDEAVRIFNLDENEAILFTYGDICYNPKSIRIPSDLIRHEETHMQQQQYDRSVAHVWWQRYFADEEFRKEQEIEAYGEQYKFILQTEKDRNSRAKWLWGFASQLASPMYGSCITHTEAMKRIRDYADGRDLVDIEKHIKDDGVVEL